MDTIVERPGALDVHKAQVTACVRTPGAGRAREAHFAEFQTPRRATRCLGHTVTLKDTKDA